MKSKLVSFILSIACFVFIFVSPTFAQEDSFTVGRTTITTQELMDGVVIPVSWSVSNRPDGTNLVFFQVMTQEAGVSLIYRNAELPRDFELVSSMGDGWVAPIPTNPLSDVLTFEMHLINMDTGSTIFAMSATVEVLDDNTMVVTDPVQVIEENTIDASDESGAVLTSDCDDSWIGGQVLLDWYQPDTSLPGIAPVLCPEAEAISLSAQYQPYERGFTIYVDGEVFAFYNAGMGKRVIATEISEPVVEPPSGLFLPADYFLGAWQSEPTMGIHGSMINYADNLGWATGSSQPYTVLFQKADYILGMGLAWGDFYMMTTPTGQVVAAREGEGAYTFIWELANPS